MMKSLCASGVQERLAVAEPGAEDAAEAQPVQALDELVGGTQWALASAVELASVNGCSQIVNRAPTWLNSVLASERAAHEQQEADQQPGRPLGGDVDHRDEQAEEQRPRCRCRSRRSG